MSELFDSNFLNKLQQLVITSKIILSDGSGGNRKSRSKGSSVEFSDYREYSPGDDYRRIDWNAFGRFEKLFVKLYMEEREAPVQILLDTSRSMSWGEPSKSIASRKLAAALGYISLANYDRVTLACLNNTLHSFKPSLRGKNSFGELLDCLEKVEYSGTTDIYAALQAMNIKTCKGITVIISDMFTPGSFTEIIKYLQYRKQEVYLCHVLSPQETNPEITESLRLIDSETGEYKDVTATPMLLKTYQKVYSSFITRLEDTCFRYGASYIHLKTSLPVEQMIKMVVNRQ
ncbi:MAG: DUF58 domain-containing protein [Clostridia bacterium]|nr:DUF58 domain-containing protein [Clostridia bacterium]